MTLRVPTPWKSKIVRQDYDYSNGTFKTGYIWDESSGTRDELVKDIRPLPKHTPRNGWRPPTSWSRDIWTGRNVAPSVFARWAHWNGSGVDNFEYAGAISAESFQPGPPPFPSSLKAKCEVGALRKLKAQNVNYSVALGERAQTADLVRVNLSRISDAVLAIKERNPRLLAKSLGLRKKGIRKLDGSFNNFLEYEYGWKPLLSDCYGAVKDLNDREKQPYRTRVTVKSGGTTRETQEISGTDAVCGDYVHYTMRIDTEHRCMVRLDYVRNDAPWASLSQLGILNPLTLAWELLPWSFVADWFVPIGAYLDILDADFGWSLLGGTCSMKTTSKTHFYNPWIESTSWALAGAPFAYGCTIEGGGRMMKFDRTLYGSSPIPSLSYLTTKFSNGSPQHVANGIALLMSRIVSKAR